MPQKSSGKRPPSNKKDHGALRTPSQSTQKAMPRGVRPPNKGGDDPMQPNVGSNIRASESYKGLMKALKNRR